MKIGYVLFVLTGIAIILAAGVTFIYLSFYRFYLSRRIANGIKRKSKTRKLVDPLKFFICSFFVFIVLSGTIVSVEDRNKIIRKDNDYLKLCSHDSMVYTFSADNDIPGYTRCEKHVNGIRCVYYLNNKDSVFPILLLYFESADDCSFDYCFGGRISSGSEKKYISAKYAEWYAVNNIPADCTLTISFNNSAEENILKIEIQPV